MGRLRLIIISAVVVLTLLTGRARAETIWQWRHAASGAGWAHVFDGGPVEFDSDSAASAEGDSLPFFERAMSFSASDWTTSPGVLAALYGTAGRSEVLSSDEQINVNFRFSTGYSATLFLGSDRPGGEGAGSMSSVAEFVMPVDELSWWSSMSVRETPGFSGSMRFVVDNVTQSTTIFDASSGARPPETLSGRPGDLIRFTFEASGQGSGPPGIPFFGVYRVSLQNEFVIPEPGTFALLGVAVLAILATGRRNE